MICPFCKEDELEENAEQLKQFFGDYYCYNCCYSYSSQEINNEINQYLVSNYGTCNIKKIKEIIK